MSEVSTDNAQGTLAFTSGTLVSAGLLNLGNPVIGLALIVTGAALAVVRAVIRAP